MRQRVRLDLGQKATSEKEKERFERKRQRWALTNRNKDSLENPFIRAISPKVDAYGEPNETEEEIRDRLARFEFGNFPGYFNYRNKAKPEKKNLVEGASTSNKLTNVDDDKSQVGDNQLDDKSDEKVEPCHGEHEDQPQSEESSVSDERISHFKEEWIKGKNVLDIGCNRGHIAYALARRFDPSCMVGVDIDPKMIAMANRDIHLQLSEGLIQARRSESMKLIEMQGHIDEKDVVNSMTLPDRTHTQSRQDPPLSAATCDKDDNNISKLDIQKKSDNNKDDHLSRSQNHQIDELPIANYIDRGPLALAGEPGSDNVFPNNLIFVEHNYVPSNDLFVTRQEPHFDTIICLSVTKWIHLNYRDEGLKRFFKRAYNHLRPNGLFILEAQPFDNYARRKRTSDRLKANFYSIQLKPEQFDEYLLCEEVGFRKIIYDSRTNHECKGFERPFKVFLK